MDFRLWALLALFIFSLGQVSVAQTSAPERGPLLLVHGRGGSIKNFAGLIESTPKISSYNVIDFSYDDLRQPLKKSAEELALRIVGLQSVNVTILAHSMGGLVAREALNFLSTATFTTSLPRIRVISIDTPWQGGTMRGCQSKDGTIDAMVERVLPAAITDMRSCSDFFAGVYLLRWPPQLTLEIYFAREGTQALDYSEPALALLPQKIADLYNSDKVISGNLFEMNFWKALSTSAQYEGFATEAARVRGSSELTANIVIELLEKHFPRFPGDHVSVMTKHPEEPEDLPAYLQKIL